MTIRALIIGYVLTFMLGCVTCTVASDMKPWRPDLWRKLMLVGGTLAIASAVLGILAARADFKSVSEFIPYDRIP